MMPTYAILSVSNAQNLVCLAIKHNSILNGNIHIIQKQVKVIDKHFSADLFAPVW